MFLKRLISLFVLFAATLPLGQDFSVAAQSDKILRGVLASSDVPTIDPALATDVTSVQIIESGFVGLVVQNEVTLELQPGMATEWSVSEDGLTYTFSLIQDVPWVFWNSDTKAVEQVTDEHGDIRFVTAHDFVYGMNRTINPDTAASYADLSAEWIASVTALDDFTLQVSVTRAASFVPTILGLWFQSAQPQWAIEESGDFWTEVNNYQVYGPFVVAEWLHDESIRLVKNPFWPGSDGVPQAKLDELYFLFLDDSAAFANWEAGRVDWIRRVPCDKP